MASTYLTRTAGTPTSSKKFTISAWIKLSSIGTEHHIFGAFDDTSNRTHFVITDSGQLDLIVKVSGTNIARLKTTRVLRDHSAWYHVMGVLDTTQSTSSDRAKLYINNSQETNFETETYPSQDAVAECQGTHDIGAYNNGGSRALFFDGLMTHFHFVDGTAYAASTFGETDSTSGIWKPKTAPSVTYGNNGFFLKFENSGNLDLDSSGNNLSFTTSGTLTQNVDTPSNNFATINPNQNNIANLSNGNLTATTSNYQWGMSTLAVNSGKWYVEMKVTHACMIMGIQDIGKANDRLTVNNPFWTSGSQSYHLDGFSRVTHDSYGDIANDASAYPTYGNGDIIMMAVNLTDNKLAYGKNGTWYNSTNPGSGTTNMISIDAPSSNENGNYGFVFGDTCGASDGTFNVNFGQGFFGTTAVASANADANGHGAMEYAVPSGYYTLNTKNIKEFG